MTVEFALDYIPRRMKELGYENNYITRWRHFQLDKGEVLKLDDNNEYYMLIQPHVKLQVKSKTGAYDFSDIGINEFQYEHKGKVTVKNNSEEIITALFIQVIPNHQ